MQLSMRRLLDKAFAGTGVVSLVLLGAALLAVLAPIAWRGAGAFVFRATIEHRRLMLAMFSRGNPAEVEAAVARTRAAREPVYKMIADFEAQLAAGDPAQRHKYAKPLRELKARLRDLFGPFPGEPRPVLMRDQYGQTRWDRARVKLHRVLFREEYDYSDPTQWGRKVLRPRQEEFQGTAVEPLFAYLQAHAEEMFEPRWTLYWRFFLDESRDAHFFGGIGAEVLGTFYLALGAMLVAVPVGVAAAVYFTEYAGGHPLVGLLRTFISTLAGVPSIVFGLFGLAFFINTAGVSRSKSVLAGSLTLGLLVLPMIIRATEEALRAVPWTYKEAALSLGAGRGRVVATVLLPAALPGILTGVILALGRAAGETAPIIFTAAVSVGKPLHVWQTLSQPTPALSWNIYNLATEHAAADEIRHVQYGMVLALVLIVLLLNVAAIVLRGRLDRRLRG